MSTRHCTGGPHLPQSSVFHLTAEQQQDLQELVRNANSLPQPRLTALPGCILRSPLADSEAYSSFRNTVTEKLSHLCSHLFQKDIMSRYQEHSLGRPFDRPWFTRTGCHRESRDIVQTIRFLQCRCTFAQRGTHKDVGIKIKHLKV